jgi:hypothetical protein
MLVGLPTAQAADTTLTLACQGTATDISMPPGSTDITIPAGKPEPTSMGIILNFTARTVAGLDFPIKITWSEHSAAVPHGSKPICVDPTEPLPEWLKSITQLICMG